MEKVFEQIREATIVLSGTKPFNFANFWSNLKPFGSTNYFLMDLYLYLSL